MDASTVARIVAQHRPTVRIRTCEVEVGCTCGALVYPCPVLATVIHAAAPMPNAGRFES